MSSLYSISADFHLALRELTELDLPDEAISDTLEGLKGTFEGKALNVAAYIANLESESDQVEAAEKRMKERKTRLRRDAVRLRMYLLSCLNGMEIESVKNDELNVKIQKPRKAVVITNEDKIPLCFRRESWTADKKQIREALNAGIEIAGATLEYGAPVLSIK